MSEKPVYSDCANIGDFQQKTLNWQRDRITQLEQQLADAKADFDAQLMARLGEPVAWRWHGGDEMWRVTTCNNKGDMTYLPDGWAHEPLYALSAKEKAE